MGAWGYRTFEDDTSCDWIGEFKARPGRERLKTALEAVLRADDIDDLLGSAALAAAEVVAALAGKPSDLLPGEVGRWVGGQTPADPALRQKATEAVARVFQASELRETWADAGGSGLREWQQALDELKSRLA